MLLGPGDRLLSKVQLADPLSWAGFGRRDGNSCLLHFRGGQASGVGAPTAVGLNWGGLGDRVPHFLGSISQPT